MDKLSERAFQAQVLDYARLRGWRYYHHRPALRASGRWSTALSGAPGLPDLILLRHDRLLFVELKTTTGRVRPAQQEWLDALSVVTGVEVYLWRPRDWDEILEKLK